MFSVQPHFGQNKSPLNLFSSILETDSEVLLLVRQSSMPNKKIRLISCYLADEDYMEFYTENFFNNNEWSQDEWDKADLESGALTQEGLEHRKMVLRILRELDTQQLPLRQQSVKRSMIRSLKKGYENFMRWLSDLN